MSDTIEAQVTPTAPIETVEVQKPLAKAYDMLAEANTVLIEKDIYKPEHLSKKLGDLYASIEEGTGIAHPAKAEAETLRKDLEASKASLVASKSELEALTKYKSETEDRLKSLEAVKVDLETQLGKFKDAKFGKFNDSEATLKTEDHLSKYHELIKDDPLKASRYWDENISSLSNKSGKAKK